MKRFLRGLVSAAIGGAITALGALVTGIEPASLPHPRHLAQAAAVGAIAGAAMYMGKGHSANRRKRREAAKEKIN